jgi:hypothetical protein
MSDTQEEKYIHHRLLDEQQQDVAVEDGIAGHEEYEAENISSAGIKEEHKVNDSPMNSSTDGSTRRFFLDSLKENAKVLQSQIGELQTDASEYVEGLMGTLKCFQAMESSLNNRVNKVFRNIFALFGYNYHTDVQKLNFFVFATQSWLIEMIKTIKPEKITYTQLLGIMKENKVDVDNFLNNLSILTSSSFNESCFASRVMEANVGKMFLSTLREQLRSGVNDIDDLDNKKFELILTDFLRKTVDTVLNAMENQFAGSTDRIPYIELFDDSLSLDDYFNSVKATLKDNNPMNIYSLKISTESFYTFAKCRLDDVISDIVYFSKNYSSIIFKSKEFAGQNLNQEKLAHLVSGIFKLAQSLNAYKREKMNEMNKLMGKFGDKLASEMTGLYHYNQAIKDTVIARSCEVYTRYAEPVVRPVKDYSVIFFQIILEHNLMSRPLALALNAKDFISQRFELGKQDYYILKSKLSDYVRGKYNNLFVKIQPIFYIEKDGEREFRFTLNKKLMFINPLIVLDIYHYVVNYIKATRDVIVENTKTAMADTKEYLLKRYKVFLGAEEKENKEKNN